MSILVILGAIVLAYLLIRAYLSVREPFEDKITPELGPCSPNCCRNYWPTSVSNVVDDAVDPRRIGQDLHASNLTCRPASGKAGCVCLTAEAKQALAGNVSWD